MPIQRKLEIENLDTRDKHTVYTMEQLRNKVKKEELFDTYKLKKKLNPEEGKFLEETIKEVDPNFIKEQEKEKKEREKQEKERRDKEAKRLKQLQEIAEEQNTNKSGILNDKSQENILEEGKSLNSGSVNVSKVSDKKNKGNKISHKKTHKSSSRGKDKGSVK